MMRKKKLGSPPVKSKAKPDRCPMSNGDKTTVPGGKKMDEGNPKGHSTAISKTKKYDKESTKEDSEMEEALRIMVNDDHVGNERNFLSDDDTDEGNTTGGVSSKFFATSPMSVEYGTSRNNVGSGTAQEEVCVQASSDLLVKEKYTSQVQRDIAGMKAANDSLRKEGQDQAPQVIGMFRLLFSRRTT